MKNYYITTAIAYASGKPHIGNTYEIVLADAIARFKRLQGYNVYLQTGADEHGEKIELKAKEAGLTPQEFVDSKTKVIKDIWDKMNTSYDSFVRTTDSNHKKVVQNIFEKMLEKDDIYLGHYEGHYCTPCESFWTESQLVDGKCPDCGRDVELKSEESYFFRLSKYQDKLIEHIENNPEFIQPESRKNEMINNFIKPGLQDLCVSRTAFTWGVPVSSNPKHVVYVWLDALSNYITNIGYDTENVTDKFNSLWPADLHIVGKDIIRFHTIYWPCFLMSLDLPLPKKIFGHPWLLSDGKMSKSKGNIAYADDLAEQYGVDPVRYYFLSQIPYASDGFYTEELLINTINTDLVNILGNLVNRTISMSHKYFDGLVSNENINSDLDGTFIKNVVDAHEKIVNKMDELKVGEALSLIFDVLRSANKYIDDTTPWILAKDENSTSRLKTVLYNLLETIRICAVYLQAFIPETSEKIFNQLNTNIKTFDSTKEFGLLESNIKLNDPIHLFERIEIK